MSRNVTLYDRLGGQEAIEAVVDRFYERVLDDDRLRPYFEDTDMDRLRRHQTMFLSFATGGPVEYGGRDMETAHAGLGITDEDFAAVAVHLQAALKEFDVDDEDVQAVAEEIMALKEDVVTA